MKKTSKRKTLKTITGKEVTARQGKSLSAVVKILAAELAEKTKKDVALTAEIGACIYIPPGENTSYCFQMTPQQCEKVSGTYVGGPCK